MAKHIVVMDDGETWQALGGDFGPAVWQITNEAYEELMSEGGYPRHLAEEEILEVTSIRPIAT